MIPPSDEVLTELGRFTWAAIALEDGLGLVCKYVTGKDLSNAGLADKVREARRALQEWPESAEQGIVDSWLRRAHVALDEERNQIFHAAPLTLIDPEAKTFSPLLGVMPRAGRRGRPDRPYIERPMTVEHLREAQQKLLVFDAAWAEIYTAAERAKP